MIERFIITTAIVFVGIAIYMLFKQWHLRKIGQMNTAVSGTPTILYFQSDTCAACPTQSRFLEQLDNLWNGRLTIEKIDADREPEKAGQFSVFTLPTTILVDETGNVRQINYGLTNTQKLNNQINQLKFGD